MANWKKSQNYKLRKKIEDNKKKQVEDIANGKEPREVSLPKTRRSTAADALDSYIARRAARKQVYGNTEPIVTGSTRTAGDIMSDAMERMKERRRQNMSESTQAAYNRMDLERALGRAPHGMFSDYMVPIAERAKEQAKTPSEPYKPTQKVSAKAMESIRNTTPSGKLESLSPEEAVRQRSNGNFSENRLLNAVRRGLDPNNPNSVVTEINNSIVEPSKDPFGEERNQPTKNLGNRMAYSAAARRDPKNPLVRARQEAARTTGTLPEAIRQYTSMSPMAQQRYHELYGEYGLERAEDFRKSLQNYTNYRIAKENYDETPMLHNPVGRTASQFGHGVDTFTEGMDNSLNYALGMDAKRPQSVSAYQSGITRSRSANKLEDIAQDLARTSGMMAPSALTGQGLQGAGIAAGGKIGSALFSTSIVGNTYQEAINDGYSREQAAAIATYMGADEFITNQIIGGIGGFGGGMLGNALKNSRVAQAAAEGIGRAIGEQGAKFAVDLAADAASEGAQEGLQYFTEKIARNLLLKENNEIRLDDPNTWYEAGYEAFLGSLNSVILNSAGAAASSPIESAYNDMVNERRRAEENAYLDLGRETGRLLADDDYRDWQSAAETGTRYYLGKEDNSSMVFEPTVDEEGNLSANIRTNNNLVSGEETSGNVVQETTQQQVSDVVNAAVDTLLSERGIENTSESTPDEAKNLTEIAVNELNSREMNDGVQNNVHNDVAGNNDSVSVPRENEQENRLRDLASDSINSNNVEKELERRATVRFKDDPDARTIYNAYFEDFADQLKNTDISARDMVQMYDENMAKAYEAGRNGRAISTLDEDADYRMFDRAFPELTSAIWQMGNNKISNTNRELKNSFRDIYGTQGQSAFDTVVRADANFSDDVDAFNRIYNAGRYGKDIKEAGDLSRFGQRRSTEIYESGFKDSADEYDNFSKTVELFKKNPGRAEKGTFINATPRTSKDVRNVMKKFSDSVPFSFVIVDTNDQRSLDSALSQLQKRGLVENQATVEAVFKSGSTGAVDTNRAFVVIDINTDNLLNTMGHELTHIAKVYDPEGYRAYSQAVLRKLADTEGYNLEGKIAYMQEQYKAQVGQELSRELAEEEIVAESAAFLNDEDVINELVSKDRTFAEKIRDWLRAVADMIKGLMDNASTRTEAKVLRKDYQAYKNAAELWTKMIDAAADTYAGKVMNAAEMDSAIRNQLDLSEGMGSKVNVPGNPLTAEEIFSLDEEIMAKNDEYNEATRNAWKNIIEADDFVSLGFPHGEYMYYILSPSARKENKWQITHYDKDGPMSDERFKEGDEKRLYDVLESYTPRKGLDVTVVKTSDTMKADDMSVRMQIPVSSEDNTKAEMEDRKTLLAVHNLTEEKLLKTLQLGGIPMPSIAIVKPSDGWDKYGSYSVVFTKDTIAPEVDRRNKVYQADAYTPTVNGIEYDIDSEVYYDVKSKLDKLDMPSYFAEEARRFNNAESGNPTEQGLRGVIDKALDNYGMKAAFLTSKGVEVADTMKEERVPRYSDDNVKIYDSLIAEFGDDLERISEMPIGDQTAEYGERFKKAYLKAFEGGTVKFKLNAANRLVEKILNGTSTRGAEILRHAADYQKNGLQYDVLQTRDTGAINRDLNEKINKTEYEEWLNGLYSGLIKDVGIYNGKERYTYAGDRRSFKQTHYPVTAENIVKVMLGEDSRGATGYQGISSIRAVSMPSFKSVDDIHNSEDRLQKIDEKEINEQLNSLEDRLDNVLKAIAERRKTYFANIGEAVMDALRNKSYAKAPETAIKNEFSKYNYEATETELKDIVSIIDEANKLPSDMFEAKPERVVGFDEIAYVLAPSTANESTIKTLDDLGIKTVKYDESKENGRTKALQNLNGVRFQISTDTSGRELSPEQSEYFADSKVVDDEGRLMVMYHGTPDGSFNTFRDGINFFTPNKEYATQYEHPSQSSRTAGKAAEAPKTYEVYLNITHPFDIRNEADRQRFVDDYVKGGWALGIDPYVPYKDTTKTGLPSWEEADNIYEWMDENGLLDEYDGILVDEGGTESGFDRGISYVTFNPNQIKSVDNENPTSTNDIRYQIGVPSEMFYTGYTGDIRSTQANIYLTNMLQASKDFTPSQNDIKKVVKELTDTYNSNMSKKELTRQLSELYTYMRTNEHVDGAQVTDTINAIARQVIREATFVDPQQQKLWDNFRKEMKKTDIYVNPEFVRDIEPDGMNALRKRYFGRVNLTSNPAKSGNDGIRTYIQLQQEFPEIFTKHVDDITNDADAINEILYGFEKARPKEMSVFGNASTEEEATEDLAQRIMDAYFEVGNENIKTQYQKTYKQLREEMKDDIIREYTDSLRSIEISDSEKLAQLRSAYTAGDISADTFVVSRAALEDYKRQQDQAARDLFRVKRDKYVDRIQRNKYKDDIIKTSKQLAKMIITPTDKQHIPTEMVKPISNVLQFIDFSSNRVNPDGSLPKRTVDADQFHNSINNILGILNKIDKNNSVYENNGESSYLVIDPDLMQNLRELSDSFAENEELKDNIDNLSTQNLRTVQQTLKALKQMVNNANKFISAGRYESVSEIAQRSISDFDHAITKKGRFRQKVDFARRLPVINMFDDLLTSGMLDAYTFTDALGETGHILYDDVREGLNRKIRNTQTAINYMEDTMERNNVSVKERNQWENDLIEVNLKAVPIGGNTPENMKVKLSAAQIMSLYLLNKRDQARMHLYANETTKNIQNGGFILEPSGRNKLQMDDKHVFKVSEADVDELVSKLTPQQKAVADDIGRFLTEVTSKWGNEVTQKLYGYNKFEAKNYFPIKVDDSTIATTSSSLENSMFLLKNIGQTKTVQPRAYNPITLQNIFDVYTAQADDMGSYNAFVTSTADLQMWINYKGKEGNVKRSLANAYGQKALQYYMNILKDINMPRENGSKWDKWLGSAVGLQRGGAIWGNLRVAIQQPFAYIRAAATMDPKYLLQGLTLNPAKQAEEWELAKKYAPIAQWKDYGFFDIGVGPSMKRVILGNDTLKDKVADIGMQPASMGDTIAWVRLWYASQAQVKAEHPELEVGSEKFYEEAGKVFGHVIDTTQVVDSILHRSEIMKDKSTTVKNATAFLSEPTKTYNMLFRAANDFVNAQGPEKRKAAKALANTLVVWIAAQAVNSAVASLISALRMHDKDKDLKEKYIEKVIPDFTDAIQFWNSIPMVKDWLSALTNNEQDDDATYSILALLPKMITELKKAANGESKKGPWGLLYQASQLSTFWGGNNFQNPLRDIDGIIDNVIIGDDMRKYYPYQKAKYNMYAEKESSSGSISYPNLKMFVATAMKAYAKGDTELGDMIVRDLKKKIPEEKIDNIFASALKEEEGIKTLARASLDGNEQQAAAARRELLSKGYTEEMIDKRLDSAFQEIVGSSEDIATSFVEKSEGWEDQLREFANYKTLQGKDKKEIRSSLKNAVTKAYADDYRAENAAGKKDIKDKLLSLSYDGEKLYSESDFTKKNSTWNK